jgi:hypothetical protein
MESDHLELLCDNCYEPVACVWFPTKAEAEAAGDKATLAMFDAMESNWHRHTQQRLKSADQLPEIDSDEIFLTWDTVENSPLTPTPILTSSMETSSYSKSPRVMSTDRDMAKLPQYSKKDMAIV